MFLTDLTARPTSLAERFMLRNDGADDGSGGGNGGGGNTPPANDGGNQPPANDGGQGGGGNQGDQVVTLPKSDYEKKIQSEKAQATKAAKQQVAEQLGVSLEDAEAIIKAHNDAQDAALSDADKAKKDAERERNEATATAAAAKQTLLDARIDSKIVVATGLDPDDTSDGGGASKIARLRTLVAANLTVDSTPDEIAAEFKQAQEDFPGLFGETSEGGNGGGGGNTPPDSDRGGPTRRNRQQQQSGGGESGFEKGRKRGKGASAGRGGYTFLDGSE